MCTKASNIPLVLKKLPQWVTVYDSSKLPVDPCTGRAASSTNHLTWGTWTDAHLAINSKIGDWLGFVFDNPYITEGLLGIDVDIGFEDGQLTQEAQHILQLFDSYTEISRSGRGFHIIAYGTLPLPGMNNLNGIEIYRDSRYFIMTGNIWQNRNTIKKVSAQAIKEFTDTYFPQMKKHKRGRRAKIYTPVWKMEGTKIPIIPYYPKVSRGGRHMAMVSVAGSCHSAGLPYRLVLKDVQTANQLACDPPLDDKEIMQIVRSVSKYAL